MTGWTTLRGIGRSDGIDKSLGSFGRIIRAEGRQWVFVYREIRRYGPDPWLVGQYYPLEDVTGDLARLTNGTIVGAASLAVAIVLALLMGLSMARSIRTMTSAAESIERLEFGEPLHKRSRLREIDDAGQSLDKARGALKWFGAYVPHRLVFRLMELGEDAVRSRRRNTVRPSDLPALAACPRGIRIRPCDTPSTQPRRLTRGVISAGDHRGETPADRRAS